MKEFRVRVPNRPGKLAEVTGALAQQGVNLRSIAGVDAIGTAVAFAVDREEPAREVLEGLEFQFTETDMLAVTLDDEPGQLHEVAQKLGEAGVNIDSVYLLTRAGDEVELGLTVDSPEKARQVLDLSA